MLWLWFWAVLVSVVIGLCLKFGMDYAKIRNDATSSDQNSYFCISWIEFAIVLAISVVIVVPATVKVGETMAKNSKLTYHEFWGGYEIAADKAMNECQRDGNCQDTYRCDKWITYHTVTDYDSKGRVTGSHVEEEVHYHHCPVATRENYYTIRTTLGSFDLGMTFDVNPVAWRDSHGLDGTPRGDPTLWAAANQRIQAGDPGPVTADKTYENYILASTRTILKKFSDAVKTYQLHKGMLPAPTANINNPIRDYYYADKMQFVGVPADTGAWNFALARLNAALGSDLQGDLHVVTVDATNLIGAGAADQYAGALNAYWQSPDLGRRALSKNGIALVLGVSDGKIVWTRAFTGMPVGNDGLNLDLQDALTGKPFTPAIFGHPVGHLQPDGKHFAVTTSGSPTENALWGAHKFQRVCMLCKTKGDKGVGYGYLSSEIQPSSGQKAGIIIVSVLFVCLLWIGALFTCIGEKALWKK